MLGAGLLLGAANQADAVISGADNFAQTAQEYAGHMASGDSAMMELDAIDLALQTQDMFGNWALSMAIYDTLSD